MKIVKFHELDPSRWDQFAAASPEAWLNHCAAWIAIEERFFAGTNLTFAVVENEEIVGIQPLYLNEGTAVAFGERLLHSGIHRHTGLATCQGIGHGMQRAARSLAMEEIFGLAELYDADRIQLNAHNLAPVNRSASREEIPFWVCDFGFQLGVAYGPNGMTPFPGASTVNADQLVDLRSTEDALFAALDDRASIRQAMKAGLQFEVTSGRSALDAYMEIAEASSRRTGEPVPVRDYYQAIVDAFGTDGRVCIGFANSGTQRLAGLILLMDKGAATYFAGVSLPGTLNFRPNDFLQWNALLWARRSGCEVYRFGPWFPEVPREWPISKVSHFKTKFGSRSRPIIQGSMFRHVGRYAKQSPVLQENFMRVGEGRPQFYVSPETGGEFLAHLLRVFGFTQAQSTSCGRPAVLYRPRAADIGMAREILALGASLVAVLPAPEFVAAFEVSSTATTVRTSRVLHAESARGKSWSRLRTLHSYLSFQSDSGNAVVRDGENRAAWLHLKGAGSGSLLLVGTDIVMDVIRYRQGDPAAARKRPTEAMWGYAGERPNYLFEGQLAGESRRERPADWWCQALADSLVALCGAVRQPMLPNGATGAIIVSGDDDQAALSRYDQQRQALGSLPITYYLHPLTKHTSRTLKQLGTGRRVELGLHPDALDQPDKYHELFAEQAAWFERLTRERSRTVRNHGFLNDGYWGHVAAWNAHGVRGSSNLPGLDGCIINGSLLPARLVLGDKLTEHWSILTAIGDGIVFVHGWNDEQSANCILDLAEDIRRSGIPGVIVVNLHPENIEKTGGMHKAVLQVVADGFVPWTMSECFDWFERRSEVSRSTSRSRIRLLRW